jgi:GNAT superfamily N-acetyltransferase
VTREDDSGADDGREDHPEADDGREDHPEASDDHEDDPEAGDGREDHPEASDDSGDGDWPDHANLPGRGRVRELDGGDVPALRDLYEDYEWWADRGLADLRRAVEESLVVGVFEDAPGDEDRLVGAARVVTDYVYYATVYDVIVASERRGEGVGRRLVRATVAHPALERPGVDLLCRAGLVEFYERVGFEPFDQPFEVPEGGEERLVRLVYPEEG